MALKIVLGLIAALLTAPLLAAMPLPSASAQEISIICYDSEGNYFYAVKKDTETCYVYPSEITPDGPGLILVQAPPNHLGKIIYANYNASSDVTVVSL